MWGFDTFKCAPDSGSLKRHLFPFLTHLLYKTRDGDKEERYKDLEGKKQEQIH